MWCYCKWQIHSQVLERKLCNGTWCHFHVPHESNTVLTVRCRFCAPSYTNQHKLLVRMRFKMATLPETNSSPMKMDGWNTFSFPLWGPAYFQVRTVTFREHQNSGISKRKLLQSMKLLHSNLANWEVSNLIANVTVAFALAVLLTYSLVGLADTGPGEGIQLAGGRDQSVIGSARYRLWNVFETLEILWSFELMFLKWTCNVWFERCQGHLFADMMGPVCQVPTGWFLLELSHSPLNASILSSQCTTPMTTRKPLPQFWRFGANGKVFSYVCGRFKDFKVSHWSTLIHMNIC